MKWTKEMTNQLIKLWNEGFTISEIGHIIGISRNAVVGKAHRLKLTKRKVGMKAKSKEIKHTLYDLPRSGCLWPVDNDQYGRHTFCGERRIMGKSYCEHHQSRAYVKKKLKPIKIDKYILS
ncbi:MAG: GcrA family cell cycle regulator [Candidimonas sp.]